nr:PAS domain S-box protein [uncultured Desulfobulbus sp.]
MQTIPPLGQLIPIQRLQSTLSRFSSSIKMGYCLIDPHGELVFDADWYCRYGIQGATCALHSYRNCLAVDPFLETQPGSGEKTTLHTYDNGFSALGAPIMIDNIHLGSMFIGFFSLGAVSLPEGGGCRKKEAIGDDNLLATPPFLTEEALAELIERLEIMVELLSEMGQLALLEWQTGRKLQKSKQRNQHLLDSFPVVVYEIDRDGRMVSANKKALHHFNRTAADLDHGIDFFSLAPPHLHPKIRQRLQLMFQGHQLEPTEYPLIGRDGSRGAALVYSQPILAGGEVVCVRSVYIDISERKAIEERLLSSEQRYRALFASANDAILLLARGEVIECNDQALHLFQRSREDLLGAGFEALSPPVQGDGQSSVSRKEQWIASAEQQSQQRFDWDILLPDGGVRETEISLSGFDLAGEPHVLILLRDMAERNQSRRTLEERESAWRAIFEHAPYAIVINRLRDGVFLDANPAYEQLSGGRRRYDILGKTPEAIPPPSQLEKSMAAGERLRAQGMIHNQEITCIGVDGTERHLLYSSAVFHSGGEPCAVSMFIDITARKRMKEQLRQNENMLASLFQAVPVGLVILRERRFLVVNEQITAITGYAASDLLNHSSRHLYENEETFMQVGRALYGTLWQRGNSYVETRFKRQDGTLCHVSLFAAPLDRGKPETGVAVAIQDISERMAMLQTLRESEQRFRQTAELSGQLIYDHDMATGSILWSGRVEEITGFTMERFNSFGFAGWYDRIHPDDQAETLALLEAASRDRTLFSATYRFRKADHTFYQVYEEGAFLYDAQGKAFRMLGTLKDVTAQKSAEEALRRSEARLTHAFSATSDAIWERYPKTSRTYYSPRWYEMFGYNDQELPMTAESWQRLCHPEDYPAASETLRRLLASPDDEQHVAQYRMRHRDGHWVWIISRGKVVERDQDGTPLLATGTNTDITKSKMAVLALKESENRYRTLFEAGSDAIFILKKDMVVECNKKTLEMFRATRDQLVGFSPWSFSPLQQPDGRTFAEHGMGYISEALQGRPQQFEWVHARLDGSLFHSDARLSAVDLAGETCLQCIVRDISEWKHTEHALRESEFRFRSFFNTNPEGILLISFRGTILDVNRAFLRESGYGHGEMAQKHFRKFVPTEDQTRIVDAILAFKSGIAKDQPIRFSYKKKDGALVPVMAKGWLVVDEKSNPLYIGVFIHNMSKELALAAEKSALEKQVIQAQRSEAIGTLAGGIAHDFNNILGGIIGYTELSIHCGAPSMDAKIREYMQRVLEGGNRAKDLVQQILRFSRHSATIMEPINLTPVIKESMQLMRSTLPSTITIHHQFQQDSDRILGDPTQIHQVVMNLATNALHAMRERGGVLSISLSNVFLDAPRHFLSMSIEPGDYLHLHVSDTGCGMPPNVVERIFEPYFTTKKIDEGTGLGMAVVLGIIKSHDGLIEVESAVGKGTRFDIYLPLTAEETAAKENVFSSFPMGQGQRVLLVDDEHLFREVIKESLQLLGYEVTACSSSLYALEVFTSAPHDYDLLLTDQTMPEMTGVQLIQKIRRLTKHLPIILCTGYSEVVSEQTAVHYGISHFLMKPVNTSDLAQALATVLAKGDA